MQMAQKGKTGRTFAFGRNVEKENHGDPQGLPRT